MKIEHKLSPHVAAYAQRSQEQLRNLRVQYLVALGQAKEIDIQSAVLRQELTQVMVMVEQTERLPQSMAGYALSADGTVLMGETEDEMSPLKMGVNGNG